MAYARKTRDVLTIQGRFVGYGQDKTWSEMSRIHEDQPGTYREKRKILIQELKEYRASGHGTYRLKTIRERIND